MSDPQSSSSAIALPVRGRPTATSRGPASLFKANDDENGDKERGARRDEAPVVIPVQSAQAASGPLLGNMKRMREDPHAMEEFVKSRPDATKPTDEAFKRMPVEDFGRALLAGMGFKEGEHEVKPYLMEGRPALLGLGARIDQTQTDARKTRGKRVILAVGCLGQIMGTHSFAVVSQVDGVPGLDQIRVQRLSADGRKDHFGLEEMTIPRSQFVLVEDVKKLPPEHPGHRVLEAYRLFMAEEARKAEEAFQQKSKRVKSSSDDSIWVQRGLRVMLVDDRDDETYKTKGIVVDTDKEKGRATIRVDKTGKEVTMKIKYLQTVVPGDEGTKLLVVGRRSDYYGEMASLLFRDKRKGICKVRLLQTGREVELDLDDVCETTR